jgi:Holliday junction resolvasome RuvABC endonuclease subunit
MYYLGLDCSTKAIHGVILDEEEHIIEQFKLASIDSNYEIRFYEILTGFEEKLSKIDIGELLVAVEAAIYIQNPKTTVALAAVVAGVKYICYRNGYSCIPVDNKVWKRFVLHAGKADKAFIKRFAMEKWEDINSEEQDYSDAACVALYRKMEDKDEFIILL